MKKEKLKELDDLTKKINRLYFVGLALIIFTYSFIAFVLYKVLQIINNIYITIFVVLVAGILLIRELKNLFWQDKKEPWPIEQWCGWRNRHVWLIKRAAWMKANKGIRIRAKARVKKKHSTKHKTRFLIGRQVAGSIKGKILSSY